LEEHLANSLKAVAYIPLVIQYPDMNFIGFIPHTPGWKFAFVYRVSQYGIGLWEASRLVDPGPVEFLQFLTCWLAKEALTSR
jgi:hypothetical protein